jgi:hypothetical protein
MTFAMAVGILEMASESFQVCSFVYALFAFSQALIRLFVFLPLFRSRLIGDSKPNQNGRMLFSVCC